MTARLAPLPLRLAPNLHPGYRLVRSRGRGAYGEVWEAEDTAGRRVALKFLPCARGQNAAEELRSIQMVRQLRHPGLVRVDRVWCAPGCLVVAMELADGSLADLLEIYRADLGSAIPADHLLPLVTQAAEALDFLNTCQHYLHGQWSTVQHCDVTPTNLLLFGKVVKLSDFGLTTALGGREKTHRRAGTPGFAAPEVFQGRVSDRTDQYALAACYCLLRSGRLPFPEVPAGFEPGYSRPAPDLTMLSPAEQPAIARGLAIVPQDRWASSGAMVAQLAHAVCPQVVDEALPERRQGARYEPAADVSGAVLATLGNGAWAVVVQNVSTGGVRLRIKRPGCSLRPGRVLELALGAMTGAPRVKVRLRLTHSVELADGDFEAGGPFERPLTPEELMTLTETPGASS
jgi:serine/threonine-protein kinase